MHECTWGLFSLQLDPSIPIRSRPNLHDSPLTGLPISSFSKNNNSPALAEKSIEEEEKMPSASTKGVVKIRVKKKLKHLRNSSGDYK
jgi:hypothetical protein